MEGPIYRNLTPLGHVFMLFNWIPSMTMLLMPMAIAEMANMPILAIMAPVAKANNNFCMGIRGI